MTGITMQAVERQINAMGAELFEIGVRRPGMGMLLREWAPDALRAAVPWLQHENARGSDVYVRPARSRGSALVLVDDLSREGVGSLSGLGLAPCVVVETSAQNFQAWICLAPDAQPPAVRTAVARKLATMLGGDMNSADYAHFGRLAGFTNRKPSRAINGMPPFVLLISAHAGIVARGGDALVREALHSITHQGHGDAATTAKAGAQSPTAAVIIKQAIAPVIPCSGDSLGKRYLRLLQDLAKRYTTLDASRADWMCALSLFSQGHRFEQIAVAMLRHSPGLATRKCDVEDYLLRTVGKAEIWHELRQLGYKYTDVRHELLQLARVRAEQRRATKAA